MKIMAGKSLLALAVLLLAMGAYVAYAATHRSTSGSTSGSTAPVASITSMKQFAGKPTIAIFFSTSCKFCAYEAAYEVPKLEVWAKSHNVNVALIDASNTVGIATPGTVIGSGQDGAWTPSTNAAQLKSNIYQWEKKYKLVGDAYFNPGLTLAQKYGVNSFPTIVVLDKTGRVFKEMSGVQYAATLEYLATSAG